MAANEFDIKRLVLQGSGYVGLPFPKLSFKELIPDLNQIGKAVLGKNILGRPLFEDCILDGVRLPNEPLITITGKKTIVETVLVGSERKGTVKEFISAGDYNIKIEGICIDAENPKKYPQDQVESIIKLASQNKALSVLCDTINLFEIYSLVIKDYGFGNMQGKPYSQTFYLTCVSDEDFYGELILKDL